MCVLQVEHFRKGMRRTHPCRMLDYIIDAFAANPDFASLRLESLNELRPVRAPMNDPPL